MSINLINRFFLYFFIEQVLISHQFYTHQCIHVNPNGPIYHTTNPTPSRLSPLGVHMFVLYICVSISALQTGSSVPFFYVPHICVNIRYLFCSFWLTSLCMTVSRSIHVSTKWPNFLPFYGWVIFHCIYVPHLLYPFICRWAFRLLPWPGYCK